MLVFLSNFLLIILAFLFILVVLALITTIKIDVRYVNKKCKVAIKLYFLEKIRYFKIELNENKLKNIFKKAKEEVFNNSNKTIGMDIYRDRNTIKTAIKKLKIDLEYLRLNLRVGTEFMLLTSVIITTISTIFPILANKFIKKYDEKKYKYKFAPIYNKNDMKLHLHCIINVKLAHIINVLLSIIFKKGVFKNVRTSNTRFNDNCYE